MDFNWKVIIKLILRNDLVAKLPALSLEFLQPFDLADLHTAVLALPVVECGSVYAIFFFRLFFL